MFGFGSNEYCQILPNTEAFSFDTPQRIPFPTNETIRILVAGAAHNMVVTANDQVYGKGYNGNIILCIVTLFFSEEGQLALPLKDKYLEWQLCTKLSNTGICKLYMSSHITHAITKDKRLFVFGHNLEEFYKNRNTFFEATEYDNVPIRCVSAGNNHSLYAVVTGTVLYIIVYNFL